MKRILTFIAALFSAAIVFGQQPQIQQLPNDPAVRKGKLDNGLTYYIRHNDRPEGRAEFYLATNVGAIQETPDQDGLAHFLEHMCFNGTKNLPGKQMLDYLQSIGAEFGRLLPFRDMRPCRDRQGKGRDHRGEEVQEQRNMEDA